MPVLLVDDILPQASVRQWVINVVYPLRFLFGFRPDIVYRTIATYVIHQSGYTRSGAQTGAVTLINVSALR